MLQVADGACPARCYRNSVVGNPTRRGQVAIASGRRFGSHQALTAGSDPRHFLLEQDLEIDFATRVDWAASRSIASMLTRCSPTVYWARGSLAGFSLILFKPQTPEGARWTALAR